MAPQTTPRMMRARSAQGRQTLTPSCACRESLLNFPMPDCNHGVVAQLGERYVRNVEVEGSIPFNSTIAFPRTGSLHSAGSRSARSTVVGPASPVAMEKDLQGMELT